jgi:hypothetical protein
MTNRTLTALILLGAVSGWSGCSGSPTAPRTPAAPTGTSAPTFVPLPTVSPAPTGAQSISGVVYDSGLRPLAGATVELLDGPQAGASTTTDSRGNFSLVAIVDDTARFRAAKDGHVAATVTIRPDCDRCHPRRWVFFYLDLLASPVPIAGDYTLTFVADSSCTNLPAELRTRSYAAAIEPADLAWPGYPAGSGTSFKVIPRGSVFPAGLNGFFLNVAGNFVNVSLGDHTDPGVTERVAANDYFAFGGWASLTTDTPVSTISTAFQGFVDYCVNPGMGSRYDCTPGPTVTRARCESSSHRLTLTRR